MSPTIGLVLQLLSIPGTVLLDIPSASEPSPVGGYDGELRAMWLAGHNGHQCGTATVV